MDRPQPSNIQAECGILGTILNNNQALDIAQEIITKNDFYDSKHNLIYRAIEYLNNKNSAIDTLTLSNALKSKLKEVGGVSYLSELTGAYTATSNIKEYCLIVKDKSNKRKIIKAANEMLLHVYEEGAATEKILNDTQDKLLNINNYKFSEVSTAAQVVADACKNIEKNFKNGGGLTGLTTGLKSLDRKIEGLGPGDYVVIAARPSMGKTAIMLTITENTVKQDKSVMVFSLEMTNEKLMNRMLSSLTKIPLSRLKTGKITPDEWELISKCAAVISNQKIYFDDKAGLTVNEIRSKAKKIKSQYGLDLIVLDYIGKIEGKGENRTQELSKISNKLKDLGKELKIPIIVLSQLSRACEARTDHRPILSDLRESGAIEQDADITMFLYRDEYYHPETEDKDILEVIFAKNRDGETGTVKLFWKGETQTIGDLDYTYEGAYNPDIFKEQKQRG